MTLQRVTGGSRVLSVFPGFEVTKTTADLQGSRFKLRHARQQTLNKLKDSKKEKTSAPASRPLPLAASGVKHGGGQQENVHKRAHRREAIYYRQRKVVLASFDPT